MAKTISPEECKAWIETRRSNINRLVTNMLVKGPREHKEGPVVTVTDALKSRIMIKERILGMGKKFERAFEKYSGKLAPASRIFSQMIGETKKEEVASV